MYRVNKSKYLVTNTITYNACVFNDNPLMDLFNSIEYNKIKILAKWDKSPKILKIFIKGVNVYILYRGYYMFNIIPLRGRAPPLENWGIFTSSFIPHIQETSIVRFLATSLDNPVPSEDYCH